MPVVRSNRGNVGRNVDETGPAKEVDFLGPGGERPAATVVVVRDAPSGVEILCVERHRGSRFMGGAVVFPGGQVEPADRDPVWPRLSTPVRERCHLFQDGEETLAFAVAALRETLEEAAILAVEASSSALDTLGFRSALSSSLAFAAELERHGLRLDTGRLEPLGRWITPPSEARRFDTRFYLLPCPERQAGLHDERETTRSFWATPSEILARWAEEEIVLMPPTSFTVELFVGARTVEDAIDIARRRPLAPIRPHFCTDGDDVVLALPGDPLYPDGTAPAAGGVPTRFVLNDKRFVPVRR